MKPFTKFESRIVSLPIDNIDTDQIIPARFLKTLSKEGLGDQLFCDWRYDAAGQPKPDFVLNQPGAQGAEILLAGDNFGCGSSREHAPWALTQFGFRAVLSTSFADIFRQNSLKNSLLPIVLPKDVHAALFKTLEQCPDCTAVVDLEAESIILPGSIRVDFQVDAFSKHCLLNGIDELGYIQQQEEAIAAYEAKHPARYSTLKG